MQPPNQGRVIRIDEYHHALNIELRMFASKERNVEFSNELISKVYQKAKLMKSGTCDRKVRIQPTNLLGSTIPRSPSIKRY